MEKSPDAFRTISEVADLLETPAHVLRFWESRFPQVRPVKRAGGRRYYRPSDVALLAGIKRLLHEDGLTIRGVQKILREQGIRHVSSLVDDPILTQDVQVSESPERPYDGLFSDLDIHEAEASAEVLPFALPSSDPRRNDADKAEPAPKPVEPETANPEPAKAAPSTPEPEAETLDLAFDDQAAPPLPQPADAPPEDEASHELRAETHGDAAQVSPSGSAGGSDEPQPASDDDLPEMLKAVLESSTPSDAPEDARAAPDAAPAEESPSGAEWLPSRLRGLSAEEMAPRREALSALHARLRALHTRMAEAARPNRR